MRVLWRRLLACSFGVTAALMACDAHAAGGAYVVDDAAVDEPGACKIESSISLSSKQDFLGVSTPACVVPFVRPIELGLIIARTKSDGEWGTGFGPKAKMNILPAETGKFGLAIAGGVAFDGLTGEFTGGFFNVPLTYTFSDVFKININGGWLYEHMGVKHFLTYGAGFEWIPFKGGPVTLIGEVFGLIGDRADTRPQTDPRFQAGIRITPIETADLDIIYGRNITGENAHWVTVGLNVRFPAPKK